MCYASCTQVKTNLTYQNNEEGNVFTFTFINTKKKKINKYCILKTDLNIGERKKIFMLRYGLGAHTLFPFFVKYLNYLIETLGPKSLTKEIILLAKKEKKKPLDLTVFVIVIYM